jgi:hypothetical protein
LEDVVKVMEVVEEERSEEKSRKPYILGQEVRLYNGRRYGG